jgi:hypothetical protein
MTMTTIRLTGPTFAAKETLKASGGEWDSASGAWTLTAKQWADLVHGYELDKIDVTGNTRYRSRRAALLALTVEEV